MRFSEVLEGCVFDEFLVRQKVGPAKFSNVGGQLEKMWLVCEGSAGEAVCWGGERGGVQLPEFEDFAGGHSIKDSARRSEGGGGGFKGYRLCRRPLGEGSIPTRYGMDEPLYEKVLLSIFASFIHLPRHAPK